jgi:hypothetical protein
VRFRDPELLTRLHLRWRECALCGRTQQLSLHHISNKPRDDVEANLVMLCGDGVSGCHGDIEAQNATRRAELASYIREWRLDTFGYLDMKFPHEKADNWIARVYGA